MCTISDSTRILGWSWVSQKFFDVAVLPCMATGQSPAMDLSSYDSVYILTGFGCAIGFLHGFQDETDNTDISERCVCCLSGSCGLSRGVTLQLAGSSGRRSPFELSLLFCHKAASHEQIHIQQSGEPAPFVWAAVVTSPYLRVGVAERSTRAMLMLMLMLTNVLTQFILPTTFQHH